MIYLLWFLAAYAVIGVGFAGYMRSIKVVVTWPLWALFGLFGNIQ